MLQVSNIMLSNAEVMQQITGACAMTRIDLGKLVRVLRLEFQRPSRSLASWTSIRSNCREVRVCCCIVFVSPRGNGYQV